MGLDRKTKTSIPERRQKMKIDYKWHWLMFTTRFYLFRVWLKSKTLCVIGLHKLVPMERQYKEGNNPWIKTSGLHCVTCDKYFFKTLDDYLNFITISSKVKDSYKVLFDALVEPLVEGTSFDKKRKRK